MSQNKLSHLRVGSDEVKKLKQLYEQGATLQQLAEANDVSISTIRNYLLKLKTKMRARGRLPMWKI